MARIARNLVPDNFNRILPVFVPAILLHSLHPWRLQGLLEILFQTISTEYFLYSSRQSYCIPSIHGGCKDCWKICSIHFQPNTSCIRPGNPTAFPPSMEVMCSQNQIIYLFNFVSKEKITQFFTGSEKSWMDLFRASLIL